MTPLKALQTSPTHANELFAQIAATTPGSVKTRERLFEALKNEIELLARLEHDHLLPVLKKHAGTKTIVAQVGERLKQLNALLRRLDKAPKDGNDFVDGVAELKTAFQAHLRDEKNVLLPKVQKALSDEEVQSVAERIEADRAEVEATASHEAEVHRAEARRKREQEQARLAAAEEAEREVRRVARVERAAAKAAEDEAREAVEEAEREARRVSRAERAAAKAAEDEAREAVEQTARAVAAPVETVRATADAGLRVAAGAAQRSLERVTEVVRTTGETTRSFAAVAQSGAVVAQAAQDATREWTSWVQTRAQNQIAGVTALMQCRTLQEVIGLQSRLVREDVELLLETGAKVSGLATSTAQNAARSVRGA